MTLVFVYGSLKRGHRLAGHLAGSRFVGRARTVSGFRLFDLGWFPAMKRDDDGGQIEGELYEIDDATLARLDRVECEGRLYRREEIALAEIDEFDDGLDTFAQTYLYLHDTSDAKDCGAAWPRANA